MNTATLTQATIRYAAGTPRETKYGPRINVVCTTETGEEVKVWGNPDDPLKELRKEQIVTLLEDVKG